MFTMKPVLIIGASLLLSGVRAKWLSNLFRRGGRNNSDPDPAAVAESQRLFNDPAEMQKDLAEIAFECTRCFKDGLKGKGWFGACAKCKQCKGTKYTKQCPRCKGGQAPTGWSCGMIKTCRKCNGRKVVSAPALPSRIASPIHPIGRKESQPWESGSHSPAPPRNFRQRRPASRSSQPASRKLPKRVTATARSGSRRTPKARTNPGRQKHHPGARGAVSQARDQAALNRNKAKIIADNSEQLRDRSQQFSGLATQLKNKYKTDNSFFGLRSLF